MVTHLDIMMMTRVCVVTLQGGNLFQPAGTSVRNRDLTRSCVYSTSSQVSTRPSSRWHLINKMLCEPSQLCRIAKGSAPSPLQNFHKRSPGSSSVRSVPVGWAGVHAQADEPNGPTEVAGLALSRVIRPRTQMNPQGPPILRRLREPPRGCCASMHLSRLFAHPTLSLSIGGPQEQRLCRSSLCCPPRPLPPPFACVVQWH